MLKTLEEFMDKPLFKKAYERAGDIANSDRILDKFEPIYQTSYPFGAIILYRMTDQKEWHVKFRNKENDKEQLPEFKHEEPFEALRILYAWSVYKGYLPLD